MNDTNENNPKQKRSLLERTVVKSAELTRYAVKGRKPDESKVVLSTHGEVAFFDQGVTSWKLDLARRKPVFAAGTDTPHVVVEAEWYAALAALEAGIEVVHGGSANTFGSMGTLLVPDGFTIPTVTATRENVRHYGLQLIGDGEVFAASSDRYPIVMMRYDYTRDYKKDFLMQKYGGGGVFVETHDFPHIHVPLSESCGGYIVIGKRVDGRTYHFTAFRIPYGYALYTPSYTIHGDGTLVGEYAITVADGAFVPADTVLIYNRNTLDMARGVVPDWKP
ncbi:MAG: hypothetical protein PHQ14_08520 [Chromatiales bacterium]|nr:hypothetical protein [Chromatiales bacterium]MDX9768304.1 hypothetical protein [Ectothiorhodospiraceae bacterium]